MGVRHRELAVEGVQFHPEAILTEHGKRLLANFLSARRNSCGRHGETRQERGAAMTRHCCRNGVAWQRIPDLKP